MMPMTQSRLWALAHKVCAITQMRASGIEHACHLPPLAA